MCEDARATRRNPSLNPNPTILYMSGPSYPRRHCATTASASTTSSSNAATSIAAMSTSPSTTQQPVHTPMSSHMSPPVPYLDPHAAAAPPPRYPSHTSATGGPPPPLAHPHSYTLATATAPTGPPPPPVHPSHTLPVMPPPMHPHHHSHPHHHTHPPAPPHHSQHILSDPGPPPPPAASSDPSHTTHSHSHSHPSTGALSSTLPLPPPPPSHPHHSHPHHPHPHSHSPFTHAHPHVHAHAPTPHTHPHPSPHPHAHHHHHAHPHMHPTPPMHVPEGSAGGAAPYYEDPMMKISRLESELESARAEIERLRSRLAESEKDRSKHDTPKAQSRYWTPNEHKRFLEALQKFGTKDVRSIATYVGSRNATQVRTHAQKYFLRVAREAKAGSALQAARKRSMSESDLARVGSSVRTPPGSPSSRDRDRDDNEPGSNTGVNNNNTSSSGIGIGIPPRQPSPSASSELTQQHQHQQQQKQRISSVINRTDDLSSSSAIPSTTLVHSHGRIREPELNVAKRSGSTATGLLGITGSASNMRGNGGDSSIPKKEDVTMSDNRMGAVDDNDRDGGNGSGEMRKSTSFERATESDIKSKLLTTDSTKGFQSSSGRPRGTLSGRVASTGTLSSLATAPPVFHLNHPGASHHFQTTSKHQSTFVTSMTNNESSSRMDFEGATWSQCVGRSKGIGTGLQAQELSSPDNQSSCNSTPRSQTNMTGMNHNSNDGISCDKYEGFGARDQQQQQQGNRQEESTTATQQAQAHEEQALQTHKSHQSPSQVMKREALPKMMPPLPPPSSIRSASQISGSKPPVGGGPNADTAGMNLLSLVATSEEKMDADTV